MNIVIRDLINKPQIINYFDGALHDHSYGIESYGFDKEKKEFFMDVPWLDLSHAKKKKLFKIFTYYSCPLLTSRITISDVDKYILKTEDPNCVDYFLDWNLENGVLAIRGVLKEHKLWLAPESVMYFRSITEVDWNRVIFVRARKWQRMKKAAEEILGLA